MGGHGAFVIGLRNPDIFKSISAFAPISHPTQTKWGKEVAFKRYLGDENKEKWSTYDASELIKSYQGPKREILVDQVKLHLFGSHIFRQNYKQYLLDKGAVDT